MKKKLISTMVLIGGIGLQSIIGCSTSTKHLGWLAKGNYILYFPSLNPEIQLEPEEFSRIENEQKLYMGVRKHF